MMRALAIVCLVAAPASAGERLYGWLPATSNALTGDLVLEMSLYEHDDLGHLHERSTAFVLAPTIGLADHVELAIPIELAYRTADDIAPSTAFTHYGAELRYRVLERTSAIVPMFRFGLARDGIVRTQVRGDLGGAVGYTIDRVQLEAAVDVVLDFNIGHTHRELHPGLGASVRVGDALRLGGEFYAELSGDAVADSWAVIGPNLAWAHSRYWLAGALDFGIHAISAAPRLNLGMQW